jgi:hypothetical protein
MPELVREEIHAACEVLDQLTGPPLDCERAIRWLADDRERLIAALDKAQRERDAMSEIVSEAESAKSDGWASNAMRDAVVRYRASFPFSPKER